MAWSSLLLTRDSGALELLLDALAELDMKAQVVSAPNLALMRIEQERFDAALCDCDEVHGDLDLLRSARQISANPKLVLIALVSDASAMQLAFNQGANFVVCKPLNRDMLRRTLRAATCVLHRLSRRFPRRNVHTLEMVTIDGASDKAILMQLGEGGLGMQALEPLEVSRSLRLRFQIPGTMFAVETPGEIAWADPSGRIGIRFVDLAESARERIREWVFSDALETAAAEPAQEPATATGRFRLSPAPQKLCAAVLDGALVVGATAIFEVIVLALTAAWPHRLMAQATALAVPALFWTVYQFLFLRAHTPGTHLARRITRWLADPGAASREPLTAPLRAAWLWLSRISARIDFQRPTPPELGSSITIQPAARLS